MKRVALLAISETLLWLSISNWTSYADSTDVQCLKTLKQSIQDPDNRLQWDFSNTTEGFICNFNGVECWQPKENKVLNLRLSSFDLAGQFPLGLEDCSSMTGLFLSSNNFSGPIPSNISKIVPFVTTLDLSYNSFSGPIPVDFSNCTYLNILDLSHNSLTGSIPWQMSRLNRLSNLDVSNNSLSGQVPPFVLNLSTVNLQGNQGLCGKPLQACSTPSGSPSTGVIVGSVVGGVVFAICFATVVIYLYLHKGDVKKKDKLVEENKWAKDIKGGKGIKVSTFDNSVSKMKFSDLMKATNEFSSENIIGTGRTGTTYKAVLPDGSFLAIKRLQESQHSEKQFMSEMATLGAIKHQNLIPLLGYCIAKTERILVYKHMQNQSLHDHLHGGETEKELMDWRLRLKISIGAARGLAWLHHSCNPRILHRNISSKSILLDEDFNARISDFGLARLMNPIDTHLSTFVNGEFGDLGYVAPEYSRTLVATTKGDVYSFGVVLLEAVTREKPTQVSRAPDGLKGSLVEWITFLSSNSRILEAIDDHLEGKGNDTEVLQLLKVACSCVSQAPKERPTMFEVFQLLRAIGEKYHFTSEDDIIQVSNSDADYPDELIVARH